MPRARVVRSARGRAFGAWLTAGAALVLAGCGGGDSGKSDAAMRSEPAADTQPPQSPGSTDSASSVAPAAPAPASPAPTDSAGSIPSSGTPKAGTPESPPAKPSPKPVAKPAKAGGAASGGQNSPQTIALGDSIFHGQVAGGTCTACHGQNAEGTAIAPSLKDKEWLNGDGSYDFIVKTVTNGVPKPKAHPAPMPAKGGASLDDAQVKAVAAYVFSLSHKS